MPLIQAGAAHHLLGRIALQKRDGASAEREARLAMEDPLYRGPGTVLLARIRAAKARGESTDELRKQLHKDAVAFAESIGYINAGTVEFLVDTEGERAGTNGCGRRDRIAG